MILSLLFCQPAAQPPARPTDPSDPMPPPNLDYFVGTWTFEWNVPESPLGPAGKLKGQETYRKLDSTTWESIMETAPVKKAGQTVRLKGKTLMLSPAHYRLQVQISVDGGPYTNFGNPWFRKAGASAGQ
jgi:hypothetical protein